MIVDADLANTVDQSNKIREMQDKIANLRAQVLFSIIADVKKKVKGIF